MNFISGKNPEAKLQLLYYIYFFAFFVLAKICFFIFDWVRFRFHINLFLPSAYIWWFPNNGNVSKLEGDIESSSFFMIYV